jgi:hypothetical protein
MVSYLAAATLAVSLLTSTPQPLEWQADYGKALAATRSGDQPLLIVLDKPGTTENRLDPALLSQGTIEGQDFELLRPYHLCHVDASTDYGQEVAKAFKADSFPFTAIIDKTGSVVIYSKAGNMQTDEWQQVLKSFQKGERTDSLASNGPIKHVSYKLSGNSTDSTDVAPPTKSSKPYCAKCQAAAAAAARRNAM